MNRIARVLTWPLRYTTSYLATRIRVFTNKILDMYYSGGLLDQIIGPISPGAEQTQSTDYAVLPKVFQLVNIHPSDVLVDVGCGQGRVILWWLRHGFRNRIIGVELNPEVAEEAQHRFRRYPNVEIVAGNVLNRIPHDGTLFYLFNPFDRTMVEAFRDRLLESHADGQRIVIVYYNCLHVDAFRSNPRWSVSVHPIRSNLQGIKNKEVAIIGTTIAP